MEEEFQFQREPPLLGGSEASFSGAYVNSLCSGISFRSLLAYSSLDPAAEYRKMPKIEPVSGESPPYKFISGEKASSLGHQLPSLLSYELPQYTAAIESPMLNPKSETVMCGKKRHRRHQQKLSDKTRCLQKLLPWDEKMDMATVLEEAYKYIKFLQAQVSVLQSMPSESVSAAANASATSIGVGDLGRLNRQQLLQVLVNSPVAQTQLYSKGCCLYSVEQLVWLKKNAERKALYQQLLGNSSNPNPSFVENDGRGYRFF